MSNASSRAVAPKRSRKGVGGQPSKLTPDVHRRICDLVRAGNYPETAAAACGIARQTILGWMREGALIRGRLSAGAEKALRGHRRALVEFSSDLDRALGEAEARDVMLIGKAAQGTDQRPGDWRASAYLLERRNRSRWAPNNAVELTGAVATVDATSDRSARELVLGKIRRLAEAAAARAAHEASTDASE